MTFFKIRKSLNYYMILNIKNCFRNYGKDIVRSNYKGYQVPNEIKLLKKRGQFEKAKDLILENLNNREYHPLSKSLMFFSEHMTDSEDIPILLDILIEKENFLAAIKFSTSLIKNTKSIKTLKNLLFIMKEKDIGIPYNALWNSIKFNCIETIDDYDQQIDTFLDFIEIFKDKSNTSSLKNFNIILYQFLEDNNHKALVSTFIKMISFGVVPNIDTFTILLHNEQNTMKDINILLNRIDFIDLKIDFQASNALLKQYCKFDEFDKGLEVFNRILKDFIPNSNSFLYMIKLYSKKPDALTEMWKLRYRMIQTGIMFDIEFFEDLILSTNKNYLTEISERILNSWMENIPDLKGGFYTIKPTLNIYNSFIYAYSIKKDLEKTLFYFDMAKKREKRLMTITYSPLMNLLFYLKKYDEYFKYLKELEENDLFPNYYIYKTLIYYYCFVDVNISKAKANFEIVKFLKINENIILALIVTSYNLKEMELLNYFLEELKGFGYLNKEIIIDKIEDSNLLRMTLEHFDLEEDFEKEK
jgi:pentatricopeptide repeat protein